MASQKELLSVKGQDKMEKLKGAEWDDMGGPELDWTPEKYMSSASFKVALGIKPDTTILSKAAVKAEKADTVKEAKEQDDDEFLFKEGDDDMDAPEEEMPKRRRKDEGEDEDEMVEADDLSMGDDRGDDDMPKDKMTEEDDVPMADEPMEDAPKKKHKGDDDDMEFTLEDLMGDDFDDAVDLEQEGSHMGDEDEDEMPLDEADDDVMPKDRSVLMGDDEIEANRSRYDMNEEDDDMMDDMGMEDEPKRKKAPKMDDMDMKPVEEDKDYDEGEEADKDDEDDEKESMSESRLVLSIKFDQADKLFESNTVLSEADKQQGRRLFEATVRDVAKQISGTLNEAYAKKYAKAKKKHEQKMVTRLNEYLDYVVEQWAKDNAVAIKSQVHSRLTESFMKNMKRVFEQHYVDVPASKVNVVESLAKTVKSLKKNLRESESAKVSMKAQMKESVKREREALMREHRARLIAEASSPLVMADRAKFAQRAKMLSFVDTKTFKKDLVTLREQYLGATSKKVTERPIDMPDATPLFEEATAKKNTSSRDKELSRIAEVAARIR